jgi:hypothetical protein
MRSKSNLFKNKRKLSKKGGKRYTGKRMFKENKPLNMEWDDDNDFEGFKKGFTELLDQLLPNGATEVKFMVRKGQTFVNAQNLNDFTNDTFQFTLRDNPAKQEQNIKDAILIGNCSDPKYPGNYYSDINLNKVIDKIKEYIQLDNINSIELFIGGFKDISDASYPCIKIFPYLNTQNESSGYVLYGNFPLNIPDDISTSEDPEIQNLYKFLKDLSSIVLSKKGREIKWTVTNNICCTCFPIFEYLKNVLNFEYVRNEGQGCTFCIDDCRAFGTTCVRPKLIKDYKKLPKFKII